MRIVVGLIVISVLIIFYFITWKLNKKVKLPDDVTVALKGCSDCSNQGCGMHPNLRGKDNE